MRKFGYTVDQIVDMAPLKAPFGGKPAIFVGEKTTSYYALDATTGELSVVALPDRTHALLAHLHGHRTGGSATRPRKP